MAGDAAPPAGSGEAFGAPGLPPRWTRANKDGVGTAYSADSKVWFTLWRGIVTEVYFPTIDTPQLRDLQFLVTDGRSFFHEEKRQLQPTVKRLGRHALAFGVTSRDPDGRYAIHKEVLSSPHLPTLLERVRVDVAPDWKDRLRLFVLAAPHVAGGGADNTASRRAVAGQEILTAEKDGFALALGASVPFLRTSVGFVGRSDGWTDLTENLEMDWEFDTATRGNVALLGELPVVSETPFTLALGLGRGLPHATSVLFQALASPYPAARRRFIEQWERACLRLRPLGGFSGDGGHLYHTSFSVLLAHEDKNFPGAFVASLSIPWGSARGDDERGGYHLVWTRDLVQTATALLAAGNHEAPLRALVYLATRQGDDGSFPQNFWVPGDPYWRGLQLDEVCHPILLAWHLHRERALEEFDPYPMVLAAAGFVVRAGPSSPQDRWEEVGGYSPSTLAVQIAALFAASEFAQHHGDAAAASFLAEYADFLEGHVDDWTTLGGGTFADGVPRYYVRVRPAARDDPNPPGAEDEGTVVLPNEPPGVQTAYPAREIVDGGFLELVRYGIRSPHDPLIVDSLRVLDRVLRVETPYGPVWRRYNHDGYGERPDGEPFEGWGQGRAWPLLTGERGHYELAAGRDPRPYLDAMEKFSSEAGFLPEQVWDEADRPKQHLALGRPTGSAMPLAWAHAEYVALLRSVADGQPYARLAELGRRYGGARRHDRAVEVWKLNHRTRTVRAGRKLRVIADRAFRLRWSRDEWATVEESPSVRSVVGADFTDLDVPEDQRGPIRFTFYWPEEDRWEGQDFAVQVTPRTGPG